MRWKDRFPVVLFVVSLAFLCFIYGLVAGQLNLWPAEQFDQALTGAKDFSHYWKNDLKIEPTRNLVPAYPDSKRFVVYRKSEMEPGTILVSGLTWGRSAYFGAILLNSKGQELHYWPVDFTHLSTARDPQNIFLHGLAVFPDGSLIIDSDGGDVLARVGPCGKTMWKTQGDFTHVVSPADDGTIWSWKEDHIMQNDMKTGRVLKSVSLEDDIVKPYHLEGIFWMHTLEDPVKHLYGPDPYHENDVEVLSPKMARAFPEFSPGDLLVSFRSLNMVAVLDGKTYALKWHQIGPWFRQHDPDFEPDGTISVFNNNMGLKHSEIDSIDPRTGAYKVLFRGNAKAPFYSWRRGKHQILANGNILVTETEHGRVFEVDPQGHLVWEFNNIYDKTRNGVVNTAIHLEPGYFKPGVLKCTPPTE